MSLFMADSAFRETNDQSDYIVGIKNSNIIILQNSLLQFSCSFHLYSYISLKMPNQVKMTFAGQMHHS